MFETPFPEISETRDKHAAATLPALQQTPPAGTAVAKVDLLALALSRFGEWRAGAAALVERYRAVAFDLSTSKGYAELTKAIAEVRAPRFAAQNVSKASKSELAGISKAIGAEEAAVTAYLADTEARLVKIRDDHDAKVAAAKVEAARVEAERIAGHQEGIAAIKSFLARCQGLPSSRIELGIVQLAEQAYGEDWQEFRVPAASAQCETLEAMRNLLASTKAAEDAAAAIEAQRLENARLAAELAAEHERQRIEQARIAADQAEQQRRLDAQAAELKANANRIAAHQRRIDEIKAAATGHLGQSAATIAEAITAVAALNCTAAVFEEMAPLAAAAQASTLSVLWTIHDDAAERERIAAEAVAKFNAERATELASDREQERIEREGLKRLAVDFKVMREMPDGIVAGETVNSTGQWYAADGTFMNADGTRSIFDDLDDDPAIEAEPAPVQILTAVVEADAVIVTTLAPPASEPEPTLTLGAINEAIAPLSITGAGLEVLGFAPAATRKGAKLYRDRDWPEIHAAMTKHLAGAA